MHSMSQQCCRNIPQTSPNCARTTSESDELRSLRARRAIRDFDCRICTASLPATDIQAVDIEQAEGFVGCGVFCLQAFPEGGDGQPGHCFPNQGQMRDLCEHNAVQTFVRESMGEVQVHYTIVAGPDVCMNCFAAHQAYFCLLSFN